MNTNISEQVAGILRHDLDWYKRIGLSGRVLHDPCIVAALLRPDLFIFHKKRVAVDHCEEKTVGRSTVTDVDDDTVVQGKDTIAVAVSVQGKAVMDLILELIEAYK
jgi:inosine-uridine nucleoside N-ribohydrolase